MAKQQNEKLNDALMKVALGYQVAEVTEEYAEVDGALKLTKRKKTKKDIPPDLKAVQLLLQSPNATSIECMSDEELEAEKQRLLQALSCAEMETAAENIKRGNKGCAETEGDGQEKPMKTARKTRQKPRKRVVKKDKKE